MKSTKVLVTAPLKQSRHIFKEHQDALDRLVIPTGVTVDRYYVVNDCKEIVEDIRGDYDVMNTGDVFRKAVNEHLWSKENIAKMPGLRNKTVERMLDGGYDYWWSIDTDVVVQPETLKALLDADKDIVSEVFWTRGWCNAWLVDQASGMPSEWKKPGLYECGMTGACTLVKRKVFEAGVDFTPIPNIYKALWGEDRHFCVRAACAGFGLWLDTHYPATHLYTEADYQRYMDGRRWENA